MTRLAYRIYRIVSSLRHWSMRRFTPGGWLAAVALLLTAGMATDTEQSLGYQAFAFLACLWFVALACAPFFRLRFEAERTLPRFGTAGQPLQYHITVKNLGRMAQGDLFVFEDLADPRPSFEEFLRETKSTSRRKSFRFAKSSPVRRLHPPKAQSLAPLLPNAEATAEMRLLPVKRGVLHLRGVSIARPDPLTLFRAFVSVAAPASITILPKRYPLPNFALPGAARYQQGGVSFASSVGESEEFVALRDYRHGDPMRRIHWRSWAKVGRPVVKEFQDEFFVRHALILDTFTEPDNVPVFEEAVSIAASFACSIDTQESLLDLLFVGPQAYCLTVGRGVAHADQMLEILAGVHTCSEKSFAALEQIVIEHSALVSGCICIMLTWDDARQQLVRKLESLGVPLLVLVLREVKFQPMEPPAIAATTQLHEVPLDQIAETLSKL
ncbi:MAG TPA: DUF58 domain-containing protein [Candidatus Acidoferrum sp.]|nr:DUF58 domain-containing protein [Candidatus Acidoferrum sp.]